MSRRRCTFRCLCKDCSQAPPPRNADHASSPRGCFLRIAIVPALAAHLVAEFSVKGALENPGIDQPSPIRFQRLTARLRKVTSASRCFEPFSQDSGCLSNLQALQSGKANTSRFAFCPKFLYQSTVGNASSALVNYLGTKMSRVEL